MKKYFLFILLLGFSTLSTAATVVSNLFNDSITQDNYTLATSGGVLSIFLCTFFIGAVPGIGQAIE